MKLNIKAKDFKETNYLISRDCAITRALRRAGLKGYNDSYLFEDKPLKPIKPKDFSVNIKL